MSGVTQTHPSGAAEPYHAARPKQDKACGVGGASPPALCQLRSTTHTAPQPRSWGCPSVPSSQRHSTQLERLCSNRQQTPACWKKFGRGGERVYIKNKQKTYHLSEGPRGLLEELLHFTKPLKWVKLNIAARIYLQHHMVGGTVQKNI